MISQNIYVVANKQMVMLYFSHQNTDIFALFVQNKSDLFLSNVDQT